jgi:hypothetical protein
VRPVRPYLPIGIVNGIAVSDSPRAPIRRDRSTSLAPADAQNGATGQFGTDRPASSAVAKRLVRNGV